MDDLLKLEAELELKALKKQVDKLKEDNKDLRDIIHENGLGEEIGEKRRISPEEEICILGIEQILEAVRSKVSDKNDIVNYDILHKNLRMIRGHADISKPTKKKTTKAELLKIVQGDK